MTQLMVFFVKMTMKTTTMPAIKSGDNIFKTRRNNRNVGRVQRLWNVIFIISPASFSYLSSALSITGTIWDPPPPPIPSYWSWCHHKVTHGHWFFSFKHLGSAYARGAQASSSFGTSTGTLRKPDQHIFMGKSACERGSTPKGRQKFWGSRWFARFHVSLNRYCFRFLKFIEMLKVSTH